eukprot:gene4328-4901_t
MEKSIRQKRKFAKIYARERTAENWELKKKYRNEATRQRRNAIKVYWMQKTEELKDKPRNFFRAFNPFIGKKNEKGEDNLINLTKDDRIIDNQREVAEVLASYFTNMGMVDSITTEESNKLDKHPSVTIIREQGNGHTNFTFKEFQQQEIRNSLQKLDVKKATGCDGISPELMKMTANQLTPSLTTLFNNCIRLKEWPSLWKRGEWRPAFKQGDKLNKKNYRPITILNTINNVLESKLSEQTMNFMENRLSIYLTTYRQKNSTETTLIRLVEDWKTSLEGREIIAILSTDMSKAFDSMYPNLLLEKLKHYGFSTDALQLIESYFEDRQNRVKLGETKSEWKVTSRGCPQGSSFGPLLWNIFQNDPVHKVEFCKISMYADDHQLYCSERDP